MGTYLVTGATGFVGGALVARLRREQHVVRAVVRQPQQPHHPQDAQASARIARLRELGVTLVQASLGDPNALSLAAEGAEVVYHCAGEGSHRAEPKALSWINVAGTENVINAARHAGVRRVVHLSCADATLGPRDRLNVREDQALSHSALDACARTLLLAEELALQANTRAFEVTAVRPAWVWGPGDRNKLPRLCAEAERGAVSLCGNGENLLSTAFVDNVVDVLVKVASSERAPGRSYHVTDSETLTAREFLSALCESVGIREPRASLYPLAYASAYLRELVGRPGLSRADVVLRGRASLFDGSAAIRDLGYQPRISVTQGMHALAQWVREQGGPSALAKQQRTPAKLADTAEFEALARASQS
jgi:nucleoside-diphosphate-sugar epimerase